MYFLPMTLLRARLLRITNMKLHSLRPMFDFFGDPYPEVSILSFTEYRKLPKWLGLYTIFQADRCVYVGKGWIPTRFLHHHNKAHEIWETKSGTRNGTQDTAGWAELRAQSWFDPTQWIIEYFPEVSHVNRAAYEGTMIKLLNPFANDETYEDRKQNPTGNMVVDKTV